MFYRIELEVIEIEDFRVIGRYNDRLWLEFFSPDVFKLKPDVSYPFYLLSFIKKDRLFFYGFLQPEKRELFSILSSLQGFGDRLALKVLSVFEPEELSLLIETNDVETLSKVKGLGRKRAERLILELKGRLKEIEKREFTDNVHKVIEALITLGMDRKEAVQKVKEFTAIHGKIESIEQAIKEIIRR